MSNAGVGATAAFSLSPSRRRRRRGCNPAAKWRGKKATLGVDEEVAGVEEGDEDVSDLRKKERILLEMGKKDRILLEMNKMGSRRRLRRSKPGGAVEVREASGQRFGEGSLGGAVEVWGDARVRGAWGEGGRRQG